MPFGWVESPMLMDWSCSSIMSAKWMMHGKPDLVRYKSKSWVTEKKNYVCFLSLIGYFANIVTCSNIDVIFQELLIIAGTLAGLYSRHKALQIQWRWGNEIEAFRGRFLPVLSKIFSDIAMLIQILSVLTYCFLYVWQTTVKYRERRYLLCDFQSSCSEREKSVPSFLDRKAKVGKCCRAYLWEMRLIMCGKSAVV